MANKMWYAHGWKRGNTVETTHESTEVGLKRAHVGLRINQLVKDMQKAIAKAGLTEEELKGMAEHAAYMERCGAETNPAGYAEMVATDGFKRLEKRIALIKDAATLDGMDKQAMAVLAGAEKGK